jgi:hypothetical protein
MLKLLITLYRAFTNKVERVCHSKAPGRNCYDMGKFISLFFWSDTRLVSGKPCSAWLWVPRWESGSVGYVNFISGRTVYRFLNVTDVFRFPIAIFLCPPTVRFLLFSLPLHPSDTRSFYLPSSFYSTFLGHLVVVRTQRSVWLQLFEY